jgi:hypothetical protein
MRRRFPRSEVTPDHHTSVLFLAISRLVTACLSAFAMRAKLPVNDVRLFAQLHMSLCGMIGENNEGNP